MTNKILTFNVVSSDNCVIFLIYRNDCNIPFLERKSKEINTFGQFDHNRKCRILQTKKYLNEMELLINKIWLFPLYPPHRISSLLQFPHFSASFLCTRVSSILTLGLSLADWLLLKTPTLTSQAQVRSITFCSKPDDRLYFFISLPTLLHHQLGWQKIKNWTNIQMTPWWLIIFSASKQTEKRKANVLSILYFVDMFQVKFKFLSMSLSNINKTWNTQYPEFHTTAEDY